MLKAALARVEDYHFMHKEIFLCARKKHFGFSIRNLSEVEFVQKNIRLAISQRCFSNGLHVLPVIFMRQQSRVGMIMMSEMAPGQGGNEIHLAFVAHKHRGKGYGSHMLDYILKQREDVDVFARCAPVSQRMYDMLQRRGFEYQYTNGEGHRLLMRPKCQEQARSAGAGAELNPKI